MITSDLQLCEICCNKLYTVERNSTHFVNKAVEKKTLMRKRSLLYHILVHEVLEYFKSISFLCSYKTMENQPFLCFIGKNSIKDYLLSLSSYVLFKTCDSIWRLNLSQHMAKYKRMKTYRTAFWPVSSMTCNHRRGHCIYDLICLL